MGEGDARTRKEAGGYDGSTPADTPCPLPAAQRVMHPPGICPCHLTPLLPQVDVDACLYELERGSSTRLGPPLPFPPLATPSGDGHTATTLYAYAQVDATSGSSLEHQRQQQLLEKQQPQGGSTAAADLHGTPAALLSREGGRPGRGMLLAQQQQQQQVEVGKSGGSDTPPTQHLPPAPAGMSPTTAAFVDAAFTSRDTEAAAFAGQPRAVLNTSLKDAACEAGRWAGHLPALHCGLSPCIQSWC